MRFYSSAFRLFRARPTKNQRPKQAVDAAKGILREEALQTRHHYHRPREASAYTCGELYASRRARR